MKSILFIFTCVISIIVIAESKPPRLNKNKKNTDQWIENKSIYGKWEWFKTECCGTKKGTINNEEYGDAINLDLNPDNTFQENSKKYRVPRTGEIFLTKDSRENITYDVIQFNDERPAHYKLSPDGDTLIFTWDYLELQTEYYHRKK